MMNSPHKPEFDLDDMELKSDAVIRRDHSPPSSAHDRTSGSGRKPWFVISAILNLALAVAFGLFFINNRRLEDELSRHRELAEQHARAADEVKSQLTDSQAENARLGTENKDLRREIDLRRDSQSELRGNLTENEQSMNQLNQAVDQLTKQRDALVADVDSWTKKYAQKAKQLDDSQRQYRDEVSRFNTELQTEQVRNAELVSANQRLSSEANDAKRELANIRKQFNDEAQASLDLIQERADLQRENRELKEAQHQLQRRLADQQKLIKSLEEVSEGDLVPFSTDITPAELSYREPYPVEGLPRRFGPYTLQLLINEFGAVERAFFVSGQEVESGLARVLLETAMRFKFTPAMANGVRVKTWQPMIVER